ncbi:MAG TPA: multicopper oxidase domain-containing protein [Candidatus Obscuribacterales bacterium]
MAAVLARLRLHRPRSLLVAILSPLILFFSQCQFPVLAQEGIAEEQRRERQDLEDMKSEVEDIKATINDAMRQMDQLGRQFARPQIKEIHLFARESTIPITSGIQVSCLSYNGKLPGPEIRIKQGELVRLVLHNQLKTPTSLHMHGLILPHSVDGVPRTGQGMVKPGETYVYQFAASQAGTYWYHPQVMHADQRSRGLIGALIVEPQAQHSLIDKDVVMILSDLLVVPQSCTGATKGGVKEKDGTGDKAQSAKGSSFAEKPGGTAPKMEAKKTAPTSPDKEENATAGSAALTGAQEGKVSKDEKKDDRQGARELRAIAQSWAIKPANAFTVYLMNGKSAPSVSPIELGKNHRVRLRVINAGQEAVPLHLTGHKFEVVAVNGSDAIEPHVFRDTLLISPADRVDLEFAADNPGIWALTSELAHQTSFEGKFPGGMACPVRYYEALSGH